ncbi:acetyl-CoA carboxylase biotin carboxyl carrier protein [Jeotgalibaca sp. MA1X17-3]|uniref:acetyl-CoA carboxylase biotin carboxyl carrier protein n=1 Tax=Jeotgalibaca sp. MA1X17-3 TaxID=2908211 RepID=UPI001F37C06C|nr:acetyl-CoA carboxylase biotin carboxyl carrier protein [Jeotgalibaca sp. MA1X17-3]UJF14701.1 acetyl-CoA carboxylase biotin carboxyl carrier protein [Jeotgalibaca sp. MA1X17-3]
MKFEQVKELISLIDHSSLKEFEFSQEDFSVRMSKNEQASFSTSTGSKEPSEIRSNPTKNESSATELVEKVTSEPSSKKEEKEGKYILSPIVGVVYLRPSPEAENYVSLDETIAEGQVVCLVEAMKIMNEIKSELNGKIVEVLIENEQVVEYNQPLFRIV